MILYKSKKKKINNKGYFYNFLKKKNMHVSCFFAQDHNAMMVSSDNLKHLFHLVREMHWIRGHNYTKMLVIYLYVRKTVRKWVVVFGYSKFNHEVLKINVCDIVIWGYLRKIIARTGVEWSLCWNTHGNIDVETG